MAPDLVRQRGIEDREERFRQRGRQFAVRQELHVDFQPLLGDLGEDRVVRPARVGFMKLDDRRDILGQRGGKALRDELPMPLHEDIGEHALQDHHRHDDDEKRPRVKALGQDCGHLAPERPPPGAGLRERDGKGKAHSVAPFKCVSLVGRTEFGSRCVQTRSFGDYWPAMKSSPSNRCSTPGCWWPSVKPLTCVAK